MPDHEVYDHEAAVGLEVPRISNDVCHLVDRQQLEAFYLAVLHIGLKPFVRKRSIAESFFTFRKSTHVMPPGMAPCGPLPVAVAGSQMEARGRSRTIRLS